MQVTGPRTTLMRWLRHRGGAQQFARWKESRTDPMPVAAVIGADPGTIPGGGDARARHNVRIPVRRVAQGREAGTGALQDDPLEVPANAEIVIEGHVSLRETGVEGPSAITPATTTPRIPSPSSPSAPLPCAVTPFIFPLHRAPAGRALGPGPGPERGVHPADHPAVPGDRRFLAAAGGVLLPGRRGVP